MITLSPAVRIYLGQGLRSIAKTLNEARVPAPRAQQGRPRARTATSIRELLYRDLYRGVVVLNKTRKRNAWGLERRSIKAAGDWITVAAPHLRIVTDAQWIATHGRLEQTRQTYLRSTNGTSGATRSTDMSPSTS